MRYQLSEFFSALADPRRKQGQRHLFHNLLTIIIMAILSGHQGVRGFTRFAQANAEALSDALNLKYGVPSFSTFQALFLELNDQILAARFIEWVKTLPGSSADAFIALDGKAIKATADGGQTKLQNFVAVVSAFGHQSGLVHGMQSYENGKSGEAQALRELLAQLGLTDKVFTMDALHTQKNI